MTAIEKAISEGIVLEIWKSERDYMCLASMGREPGNKAYVETAKSLKAAVEAAVKGVQDASRDV